MRKMPGRVVGAAVAVVEGEALHVGEVAGLGHLEGVGVGDDLFGGEGHDGEPVGTVEVVATAHAHAGCAFDGVGCVAGVDGSGLGVVGYVVVVEVLEGVGSNGDVAIDVGEGVKAEGLGEVLGGGHLHGELDGIAFGGVGEVDFCYVGGLAGGVEGCEVELCGVGGHADVVGVEGRLLGIGLRHGVAFLHFVAGGEGEAEGQGAEYIKLFHCGISR